MRILIIGHPGSGKTYVANKLSKKLAINKIDIDVLFDKHPIYLLSKKLYKNALSKLVDNKKDWIIDGYHTGRMPSEIIEAADTIIFLNLPKPELKQNVLNRYKTKKASKEFSHWQSFRINNWKNFAQIKYEDEALKTDVAKVKYLKTENVQVVELHSREEIESYINTN